MGSEGVGTFREVVPLVPAGAQTVEACGDEVNETEGGQVTCPSTNVALRGLERLCRYLVHPPIAVGRLRYDGTRATYRGRRVHPVSGAESVRLDPLEMLARLCQHLPAPGMHLTRM